MTYKQSECLYTKNGIRQWKVFDGYMVTIDNHVCFLHIVNPNQLNSYGRNGSSWRIMDYTEMNCFVGRWSTRKIAIRVYKKHIQKTKQN